MKRAVRLAAGFGAALVVGLGLLVASSLLTSPAINQNIESSADQLARAREVYPWYSMPMALDGFTDALKLNITYHDGAATTVTDALTGAHYSVDPSENLHSGESLGERVSEGKPANARYAHYWHGYLPFQRIIFAFLDYAQWRLFNTVLMSAAMVGVLVLMARRLGAWAALGFALTLVPMAPHLVPISLQYAPIYYIVMAGVAAVLALSRGRESRSFDLELFGAIGIAVAYLDLLTTPLLALTIPLLVLLAAEVKSSEVISAEASPWGSVATTLRATAAWVVGYVGYWAAKWVFNDIAFGFGGLGEQLFHTMERAGLYMAPADRWATLLNNVFHIVPAGLWPDDVSVGSAAFVALSLALVPAVLWIALAVMKRVDAFAARRAWPILAVGLFPILWLLFASEHTFIHAFFAFRVLWATLFACWLWFVVTWRGATREHEVLN